MDKTKEYIITYNWRVRWGDLYVEIEDPVIFEIQTKPQHPPRPAYERDNPEINCES